MRIAIYSPYLDTGGGGEKYILTIAEILSKEFEVDVLLDKHLFSKGLNDLKSKNERVHGLDLSKVRFILAPVGKESSFFQRIFFLKKYDFIFYNSDGSIFLSTAKKSILHFQLPLDNIQAKNIWEKIKLNSWKEAIFNSNFTKDYIQKRYPIRGLTVYPPVDLSFFKVGKKKKQILSVGFFSTSKPKKQELLIKVFKDLINEQGLKQLSLHLAGGIMEGNEDFLSMLKRQAKGYNIFFYPNIELNDLINLYSHSLIYWHGAGYGESDPKKFEHFGITTVESMASGCIPVVINKGGQIEIVTNRFDGFLWNTPEELKTITIKILNDKKMQQDLSQYARTSSEKFSKEKFEKAILNLIHD